MIGLTIADIARLTDGTPSDLAGPAEAIVDGPVVADSRNVVPGSLFVAITGVRADGHDFAAQAIAAGAKAVLAARPVGVPAVVVDDTVLALGRLARGYLARLADPVVVGITGSSGKTSTKDLVGQLLAEVGPTIAPVGSFNTEVGLPLTVLRAGADTRYLVLEFSARGLDHIAYLCGVAQPRIGVVLNVGAAHLGEFGSRDVVARAKGELIEALPDDGVAVLNADDDVVVAMRARTRSRVVTFGRGEDADVRAADVRLDGLARPSFRLVANGAVAEVALSLHGEHHVSNALAAAAVALELGLTVDAVAEALGRVRPISAWRMQVATRADGVTVINDAYNANPESMRAALAALAAMGRPDRRTHAVLGPMAELGPQSEEKHRELGTTIASLGVERLVVVGPAATAIADGAIAAGFDVSSVTVVDDVGGAVKSLEADLRPDDVVLVKASRSADLQRVAEALLLDVPPLSAPDGAGR
ncbi:MAG: UDP-N-acetylmuramoyl-tripeptide--D-alanyl-D-alanine ligase [Actinomycetota bacterium]|nr:UDP-N-acetylmuramoyl-tripeptide--D-alanyl-D-alanine ligase [Actinomycetota bacterium]